MKEKVVIELVCNTKGSDVLTKVNLEWLLSNFYPQGAPYEIISVERDYHKEPKPPVEDLGGTGIFIMGPDRFYTGSDDNND